MKKLICALLVGIFTLSLLPVSVFAKEKKQSVYAESALQEEIMNSLMKTEQVLIELDYYKLHILQASISPVYEIDWEKSGESGKAEIQPQTTKAGESYAVKFLNEKNSYAGTLIFSYDGANVSRLIFPSQPEDLPGGGLVGASLSYADQAERIRKLLGAETVIAPEDVRLVAIDSIGYVFYIQNALFDSFVPAGWVSAGTVPAIRSSSESQDVLSFSDIQKSYDDFLKRLEAREQSALERIAASGYDYDYVLEQINAGNLYFLSHFVLSGGFEDPLTGVTSDIGDIEAYFRKNVPGYRTSSFGGIWLWVSGAAVIAAVSGIILLAVKKKRSAGRG